VRTTRLRLHVGIVEGGKRGGVGGGRKRGEKRRRVGGCELVTMHFLGYEAESQVNRHLIQLSPIFIFLHHIFLGVSELYPTPTPAF
jgi:hypothetical protein